MELLVVLVILGILASLTTLGINAAINSATKNRTEALVLQLSAQLDVYRLRWGDFPPSTLAELGTAPPNAVNNGIEALTACLASRRKGGQLLDHVEFSNTDADVISINATDWFFGDNQLREVADSYGFPLVYLHHKDYVRTPVSMRTYLFSGENEQEQIEAVKDPATQAYFNPDKFQILSVGKDGKWGTDDDLGLPR
ncbi:MAG: hypothetical protein HY716_03945 [Planctomycetes bacterium]|nr:hypothetical protein [Planctomycetota bacterium]